MVFHDPLSPEVPEWHAKSSFHGSRKPQRVELKRGSRREPATRAAAIEAVSRELKLLALSRGISAG
jgi:hypothetical protein